MIIGLSGVRSFRICCLDGWVSRFPLASLISPGIVSGMRWITPVFLAISSGFVISAMAGESTPPPIRLMLIDGFGNHDWRGTTRLIRDIIGSRKDFQTVISTAPASTAVPDFENWCPDLENCDVVIQTCNDINGSGPLWNERARRNFETFVSKGGGVFVFHSANNAFPKWDAYNEMIGLGWRDQSFGSAIRIRTDETLEFIPPGEGKSTGHGARSDRAIHRLGNHPIHNGFPRVWMTPLIEVYTHARGPAKNVEVLSWAEDPATRERWPIEWTVAYGQGRIYTSTFGHVWKDEKDPVNLRCAGFQTLFVRALQWLAKRDVDPVLPEDFPTESAVSLRDPALD